MFKCFQTPHTCRHIKVFNHWGVQVHQLFHSQDRPSYRFEDVENPKLIHIELQGGVRSENL